MKSGCKPEKTLRMAVGGAFSSSLQAAYDKQARGLASWASSTTAAPGGGDFGPGRNPRDPNARPVTAPGGNELTRLDHTMSTQAMPNTLARPAVEPAPSAPAPQPTLRSATAPSLAPSALEQRLNDRMNAGTLTIRGAGMLQGMEDSRRQADMQRYEIDTQANTSRYSTDKQWDSNRYSTDKQWDSSRYNTDQQLIGSKYGDDMRYKGQVYNTDAQERISSMNNDTNLKQIDASIYNNTINNNTQNSIADKQQQTALANLQNSWNMNQYNTDASVFNNLASRSRSFGLRNGGEIHAANGFMPGGYAERGASIKWLSPYDGIKATAALADMDLKQDYMRAQTEALRAQTEAGQRRLNEAFEIQQANNMSRLAEDKARLGLRLTERQLAAQDEDRKMLRAAFDTKLRNDAQDRALAMQDREVALRDAQAQQVRDNIRYADDINYARARTGRLDDFAQRQYADSQARTGRLDEFAKQQYSDSRSRQQTQDAIEGQRYNDAWARTGRLDALAKQQYADSQARTGRLDDFAQRQYADSQARTGRLDEFAKQQYADSQARTGRLDDFAQRQYADTRIDRANALSEEQRRYDAAQRIDAERYGQAQRRLDTAESLQLRSFNYSMERAKREESYLNQARADARNRQITGDTYALEDRARNYDMLQQANARLNADRRAPVSFDPRFTQNNGVPRFGLRNGGDMLQTGVGGVVPGKGKGDKIPAKYEPGEFVVSNDMLDAEPGLRDHLRGLRTEVLASKGMTVAEADAKAMGGGRGLRAVGGFDLAGMYPANLLDLSDVEAVAPRANTAAFDEEVTARAKELRAAREKAALEAREQALREISERSASTAAAETAQGTAKAAEAAKGSGGVLGRLKDVAGLPGRALDGIGDAVGSGLRSAGEFLAKHPKVVGALTSPALNVGAEAVFHHNELAPGTVPDAQWSKAPTIDKPRRDYSQADARRIDNAIDTRNATEAAQRASDLRSYADAQSAALDAGKSAPALPKSLRDTGNIYKTVDDQGRVTYSGGNVKAGAKFIGGDGEEFTPGGSVEYAKPGTRFAATPDGKGVAFTPVSEDKNQRAADIAQNAVDVAKWKAKEAAEAPLRAKEQERLDMIGEVRSMEQAAMSGDQRAAAMLPGARNLLADRLKTDALERSEAEKNATHLKGIELQNKGALELAAGKQTAARGMENVISQALKKVDGDSERAIDLLSQNGLGDAAKILSERVTADNDRRTKNYENMLKEFKGMVRTPDGAEIPGGAELAADELMKMVRAENEERAKAGKPPISNILDADDRAGMMKKATLRARAISGMRAKQTLRDASMIPWAGRTGAPAGIIDSAVPKRIGWFDGATTLGDVERGDYEYDKYYLPQGVGQDVIDYLSETAKRKAKGAK